MSAEYQPPSVANQGPPFQAPEGFPFDSSSPLRQYAEPAGFFLVPSIAVQTVMHDKVAAAVDRHSSFLEHPYERLIHTGRAAVGLVFLDAESALADAERLWQFHTTVEGVENNVSFSANDAELQVWVLGCVFKGVQEAARRWSEPLSESAQSGVYHDIKTFSRLFGIPSELMPDDLDAFNDYWFEMLTGDQLLQGDSSRELLDKIFDYNGAQVLSPMTKVGKAVTKASIEPSLLNRSGHQMTVAEKRTSARVDRFMQRTYARIPKERRQQALPAYLNLKARVHTLRNPVPQTA